MSQPVAQPLTYGVRLAQYSEKLLRRTLSVDILQHVHASFHSVSRHVDGHGFHALLVVDGGFRKY